MSNAALCSLGKSISMAGDGAEKLIGGSGENPSPANILGTEWITRRPDAVVRLWKFMLPIYQLPALEDDTVNALDDISRHTWTRYQ